ncbi:hypothetical protein BDV93DRAFT_570007 [Ceratobasidium sp. AG-I]|nr:hypothetical protein BDV93DRAFT_570007 [Ceratobasidium sp. AG-I]
MINPSLLTERTIERSSNMVVYSGTGRNGGTRARGKPLAGGDWGRVVEREGSRIANSPRKYNHLELPFIRLILDDRATENLPPGARAAAKAGATGVAVGAAVFAVPPLLGFTTAGVAAGSLAAVIQSAVYGAAVPAAAAAGAGAVGGGGGGEGGGNGGPHDGPEGGPDAGRGGGPHKGGPHISKRGSQSSESPSEQDQQGVTTDSSEELPPYEEVPAESSIRVLAVEDVGI